ncbi:hypothetical protein EV177_009300, partial [Coemansia sp. RSA 1804]
NSNGLQASSDFRLAILNAHRAECKVELLQEELQTMTERCARLEYGNSSLRHQFEQYSNPRQCTLTTITLPHEITEQEFERIEGLEEKMIQLEDCLEQAEVERSVLEADLVQTQEENQALEEHCAQLEEDAANLRQCTLPHGMTKQEHDMLKHLKKRIAQLEHNLEQTKVKRLVV